MRGPATTQQLPPAVVVGLCAHGLAVVHALADRGVEVHALEAMASRPGARTRHATVHLVEDVNGPGLVDALVALAPRITRESPPVLLLTNDNMVRTVAAHRDRLLAFYRLSWHAGADKVAELSEKASLEAHCRRAGLLYPRTTVIASAADISARSDTLDYPVIAKPSRPLSGFKTRVCADDAALRALTAEHAADLPYLVQTFIPGGEERLTFCALYLDAGEVLARFEGRKLRARPMGHTTVADPHPDEEMYRTTLRFFEGTGICGYAALEAKRDDNGRLWIIEPTIARSDAWLQCCTANGVNFPYVEYCHQAGLPIEKTPADVRPHVWINVDRDPASLPWYLWQAAWGRAPRRAISWTYGHRGDLRPLSLGLLEIAGRWARQAGRFARRPLALIFPAGAAGPLAADAGTGTIAVGTAGTGIPVERPRSRAVDPRVTVRHDLSGVIPDAHTDTAGENFFATPAWLRCHAAAFLHAASGPRVYVATTGTGRTTTALVMRAEGGRDARPRVLRSASNYYWPLFSPLVTGSADETDAGVETIARHILAEEENWDIVDIEPVDPTSRWLRTLETALRTGGRAVASYFRFGNWYLPVDGRSYAEYHDSLGPIVRNTLRRKRRALERIKGYRLSVVTDPSQARAALRDYETVYRGSWKREEPYPQFIRDLVATCADRGWLRLGLVHLDDRPVAAQIWIVYAGTASIYKLAYDESYARLSAGTVLTAALMEHVIDIDEVRVVDYLSGDDPYKKDWMPYRRERRGLIAFNPRTLHGLAAAGRHFAGRAARRVLPDRAPPADFPHRPTH